MDPLQILLMLPINALPKTSPNCFLACFKSASKLLIEVGLLLILFSKSPTCFLAEFKFFSTMVSYHGNNGNIPNCAISALVSSVNSFNFFIFAIISFFVSSNSFIVLFFCVLLTSLRDCSMELNLFCYQ
jgi:hypothetical protein